MTVLPGAVAPFGAKKYTMLSGKDVLERKDSKKTKDKETPSIVTPPFMFD